MSGERERQLQAALDNNVAWCDAVCRAAAGRCHTGTALWTNTAASPPFYPNAITITASAAASQRALASAAAQWGNGFDGAVKDSFANLNPGVGFDLLFEAEWIFRARGAGSAPRELSGLAWRRLSSANELAEWEAAWAADNPANSRVFADSLIDHPDISFLAGISRDRIVCGAVASRAAGYLGISNLFALPDASSDWRDQTIAAAQCTAPELGIVGYAAGDELARLLSMGFAPIGRLRVWSHRRAADKADF